MKPRFSVIMPLYNKAPYVRKAVESVVGQTFADWELIVVDDCSSDASAAVVEQVVDSRIRVVRLEENGGVSAARNRGVAESTAPFICFLDADDWWEPTFLEEMAGLIAHHPGAGVYGTSYYIVKNGRKRMAPIGVDEGFTEGEINYCRVYAKTLCMPLWTGAVCMPRTVFDEAGGFPVGIKLGEDFLLWVHIALKHSVVLLNKPLSNYNQDVDVTYRGTHHLHEPQHHMLWHLGDLETFEQTNADYKQMVDNLRTYGLWSYHLDSSHHKAAATELAKVDWSRQTRKTRRLYRLPLWLAQCRQQVLLTGSRVKRRILQRPLFSTKA